MSNITCIVDLRFSGWAMPIALAHYIMCFFGAIGAAVSIWCLSRCQRTGKAVKVQLICLFSIHLIICIVTLPIVTYLHHAEFLCWEIKAPKKVQLLFAVLDTGFSHAERASFMVIGICRAVAVCSPYWYKRVETMKMVIISQIAIFLITVPPWVAIDVIKFTFQKFDMTQPNGIAFGTDNEASIMMALHGTYYGLSFVITFIAYAIMMLYIIRQKHTSNVLNQVGVTIRLILLANLLMDGPHVVVHLMKESGLITNIATHVMFHSHYAVEHIIFIGMNQQFRKEVADKICGCVSFISVSPWQSSYQSKDTEEVLNEYDKDAKTTEC